MCAVRRLQTFVNFKMMFRIWTLIPCKPLPLPDSEITAHANVVGKVILGVSAQSSTPTSYTDPGTGIVFNSWTAPGGPTFGFTFPSNALTTDATEFIGYIVGS